MLQCMREAEDVQEYLDGDTKQFYIRRLLEWLRRIDVETAPTSLSFEVRLIPLWWC